ncbi:MAG: prephenate dehydrogenase/arogenate dehydrogenase family protein [Planctomyces sp.]|nr:prephenate dehydrogenase/arogenate dehydrogenase family protein [Planctomyces sp.]
MIAGVGLIGGSIAAALRKRMPACRITGVGRSRTRLEQACAQGLIDDFSTTPCSALSSTSIVVICLPVEHIAESVIEFVKHLNSDCVITDGGSVKGAIYEDLRRKGGPSLQFVGAHPIAGSEQSGFENADPDLYEGRTCVITPEGARPDLVARVTQFWGSIGCRTVEMTASEHDQVLALTSHLPHVMASVTAACVQPQHLPLTGTGFRDTTRVAAGAADLWAGILLGNQRFVVEAMLRAEQVLQELRLAVESRDSVRIEAILHRAAVLRQMLD